MKGIQFLNSLSRWQDSSSSLFSPLEIPKKLLQQLKNPQDKYKTIHVAGTNGKGTTCALFAEVLKQEGFKVGLFTSPHLIDVTERCRINSKSIEQEKFNQSLEKVAELVNWDSNAITYFVATAIASFLCFKSEKVDYAVIEVGLGGLYDATNVIKKPELTVITNIALDHTDVLGRSIKEIALNKAGIIKEDVPLITGKLQKEAHEVLIKKPLILENYKPQKKLEEDLNLIFQTDIGKSAINIVKTSQKILNFSNQSFSKALENFYWPARMELKNNLLIDAAHNLAGLKALFNEIPKIKEKHNFKNEKIFIALKKRAGWERCLEFLKDYEISFVDWEQGLSREEIATVIKNDFEFLDVDTKLFTEINTLYVVTGSIYYVSSLSYKE